MSPPLLGSLFVGSAGGGGGGSAVETLIQESISYNIFSVLAPQTIATWTMPDAGIYDLTVSFGWSSNSATADGLEVSIARDGQAIAGGNFTTSATAAEANDPKLLRGRSTIARGENLGFRRFRVYVAGGGNTFTLRIENNDFLDNATLWDLVVRSERVGDLDAVDSPASRIFALRADRGYALNFATTPDEIAWWRDVMTGITAVENGTVVGDEYSTGWTGGLPQFGGANSSRGLAIPSGLITETSNDYTLFAVHDNDQTGSAERNILACDAALPIALQNLSPGGTDALGYADNNANQTLSNGSSTTGRQLLRFEYDSGAALMRAYRNGTFVDSGALTAANVLSGNIGIHCYPTITTFNSRGFGTFVAAYREVLSSAETDAIETLLTNQWGPFP